MASRPNYIPYSFTAALDTLKGKQARKIGNNTRLVLAEDGSINVVYHTTSIIKLNRNGSWAISDGGFDTVTTRARLSVFLWQQGFRLARHKGVTCLRVVGAGFNDILSLPWEGSFNSTSAAIAIARALPAGKMARSIAAIDAVVKAGAR